MIRNLPVFGICGYSGAGKTTLIEAFIRKLTKKKLKVGVIKHDVHGLNIDHEGKDSDRFFKAGADVILRGPEQYFFRSHRNNEICLENLLKLVCSHYDIILVEGHKSTPLFQKIWLLKDDNEICPPEAKNIKRVLKRNENRLEIVMNMIKSWLPDIWNKTPVYAGILIGGESKRMGQAKHLLHHKNKTWLENIIDIVKSQVDQCILLGKGHIPDSLKDFTVIPDLENVKGPLSGMLSAMQWNPLVSWIFIASDLPLISSKVFEWILSLRKPGIWSIIPQLNNSNGYEPLLAFYDFRAYSLLKNCRQPVDIVSSEKVLIPTPDDSIQKCWKNFNTREDLKYLLND